MFLKLAGAVSLLGLTACLHPIPKDAWLDWTLIWASGVYWAVMLYIEERTEKGEK